MQHEWLSAGMILCQIVMLFVAEETTGLQGKNPELAIEQSARALNPVCRLWQERRRRSEDIEHVANVIDTTKREITPANDYGFDQ